MKTRLQAAMSLLVAVLSLIGAASAQRTELARTPPMGWNSWNHFRINIDDATIRTQADALVKRGMRRSLV